MTKPKLLVLQSPRHFHVPTYAESPDVAEQFDVTKFDKIVGNPDLVYTQAYGKFYKELTEWGGPFALHLGGNPWLELRGERLHRARDLITRARLVTCVSRFLEGQVRRGYCNYSHEYGKGILIPYLGIGGLGHLPGGLWGQNHTPLGPSFDRIDKTKTRYHIEGRPVVIMSLGLMYDSVRQHKWRGIPKLLLAAQEVAKKHDIIFRCFGRGDDNFSLLSKWAPYGFQFVRQHHLDDDVDNWPAELVKADVFFHPSCYDCWPRVIAEAMIAGLPCVTFDATGNAEVGESVLKVDPEDPEQIARVLDTLLSDMGRRATLGKRCRAEAVDKSWKHKGDLAKLLRGVVR